jgi:GTPase SAR1 family protein
MIAARGRYPPFDESEPKYRKRKPGPKELPKRNPKPKQGPTPEKEFKVALLGLENSGKTTALYKLKLGEVVPAVPSKYRADSMNFFRVPSLIGFKFILSYIKVSNDWTIILHASELFESTSSILIFLFCSDRI